MAYLRHNRVSRKIRGTFEPEFELKELYDGQPWQASEKEVGLSAWYDGFVVKEISIQTALSVGEPVKNLETSELNEFVALTPTTMRTMPPAISAREMILFIMAFEWVC